MTFDLIDEPWIPVIRKDLSRAEVSLRDALCFSQDLLELREDSPLTTAALHRLLLAVMHRALPGPSGRKEWLALWRRGKLDDARISTYFKTWRERFDLLHAAFPFYQVANLEIEPRLGLSQLATELARGNNPTLFDHSLDSEERTQAAPQAARSLVTCHAFALGGGKGPTSNLYGEHPYLSHGSLVGGVVALLRGNSLFETLLLNFVQQGKLPKGLQSGADDLPPWERDKPEPPVKNGRLPHGIVDLYTWQSRCVRLDKDDDGQLRRMSFAQGQSLQAEGRLRDPMWFYRVDRKDPTITYPERLSPDKALWRQAHSLFAFSAADDSVTHRRPMTFTQAAEISADIDRPNLRCSLIGLANDKAKPLLWAHEDLPLSSALLESDKAVASLTVSLDSAELVGSVLGFAMRTLAGNLLSASANAGGRAPDTNHVARFALALGGGNRFWSSLEVPFKQLLMELGTDGDSDRTLTKWRETLVQNATSAFDAASDNSNARSARELHARISARGALTGTLAKHGILIRKGGSE